MSREDHIYQLKQYLQGKSICMCPSSSLYWQEHWEEVIKPLEQEPRKGHWVETHDDWGNGIITDRRYKCSVCHGKHIDPETGEWNEVFDYKYPFCPNCGAKMESEE